MDSVYSLFLAAEWIFITFSQARSIFQQFGEFYLIVWLLDHYWKVFNQPSKKLTSPEIFLLACYLIVLFLQEVLC